MKRIIIIESDEKYLSELAEAFSDEFDVCGMATDGNVGIGLVNAQQPDICAAGHSALRPGRNRRSEVHI